MKATKFIIEIRFVLKDNPNTVISMKKDFHTEDEVDAYIQGVKDTIPWSDYKVLTFNRSEESNG